VGGVLNVVVGASVEDRRTGLSMDIVDAGAAARVRLLRRGSRDAVVRYEYMRIHSSILRRG
jgi:hypothetical protein